MRLATLRDGTPDGGLIIVGSSGETFVRATAVARTLQAALDDWENTRPALERLAAALHAGKVRAEQLDSHVLSAPLPARVRVGGRLGFLNHVVLVRKARGAEPPRRWRPIRSSTRAAPASCSARADPHRAAEPGVGPGLRGRGRVILGDTPLGTTSRRAEPYVRLVDARERRHAAQPRSRRAAKGFGSSEQAGDGVLAVRGDAGRARRRVARRPRAPARALHAQRPLVGDPDAGAQMHFSFFDLIQHIAKTRRFTAGTILGSGTVSNADRARGISCLAERRMIETHRTGRPKTPSSGRDRIADRDARRRGPQPVRQHRAGGHCSMKLYSLLCARARAWRVRIALELKGLAYEYHAGEPRAGRRAASPELREHQPACSRCPRSSGWRSGRMHRLTQSLAILGVPRGALSRAAALAADAARARPGPQTRRDRRTRASSRCRTRHAPVAIGSSASTEGVRDWARLHRRGLCRARARAQRRRAASASATR